MSLIAFVVAAGLLGNPRVEWSASPVHVAGLPYMARLEIEAPKGGATLPAWMLGPAAFELDGKPLGPREDQGSVQLPEGFKLTGDVDLAGVLPADLQGFKLQLTSELSAEPPVEVKVLVRAPSGTNFMQLPLEELSKYQVLLRTNRGDMLVRLWPDVAPNHVRNFLDLASIKFYDGTGFHRIIVDFMIQGGDPTGSGSGTGPRTLEAEIGAKKHVRGVVSMARGQDPNSASCQFFIVHGTASHLDGAYSAFGELEWGLEVVDRIARAPILPGNKPREPQVLEQAVVVMAKGGE